MTENNSSNSTSHDEIDLGQLFRMIGDAFKKIFQAFLKVFVYLKSNALILIGLVVLGVAIGFGLNQITTKKLKTEVIVKPYLESKNYLYGVVNEIQANLKEKDTSFFKSLEMDIENLNGYEISVESISYSPKQPNIDEEMKYLELLQSFGNSGVVSDVLRDEILDKSSLNHRITFIYKDADYGQDYAQKLMWYINSNKYFSNLIKTYSENANERIKQNEILLGQIDNLINNYTKKIVEADNQSGEGRIVLDNEEKINVTGLFDLKNGLIRDIETKRLELAKRNNTIGIINFGKTQIVQKSLFGKSIILFPCILITMFFFVSLLKFLNREANKLSK